MNRKIKRLSGLLLLTGLITAGLKLPHTGAAPSAATYREPVVLSSQGEVLEIELSARQGQGHLDTVARPVENMLLFSYKVLKGQASDGQMAGENLYPAPTLKVQPGQTLIVHLTNNLTNLSIRDLFNPAYAAAGTNPPIESNALSATPFNLHTHGLHVTPLGNSDNVLLMLPPGAGNTYSFKIPKEHAPGLYWYHGHLHTLTTAQTYMGLAGMLVIGRGDGNIPAVTENQIPVRNMALQYNFVSHRAAGGHQLNNPNWGQFVSTRRPPAPGELESGRYKPSLAPVNFADSPAGTKFIGNWYAGNLSIDNHRGQYELIPNNLLDFQGKDGGHVPPDPALPDRQRDVQFTVNGQFQPKISSRPGQTEIWNLANVSDLAYIRLRLTETATGKHPPIVIVAQDGIAYDQAQAAREQNGTILTIPPASRYSIAVTIPNSGELVLDMPPAYDLPGEFNNQGVVYTSQGPGRPATGQLGSLRVDPKFISYFDGFFIFPTQELLRAAAQGAPVAPLGMEPGQKLGAHNHFVQTKGRQPDVRRKLVINGGFLNEKASLQEPKAFIYAFNGRAFPHTPVLRCRLNSLEEWSFANYNNDEHPIHIHVNDFQVVKYVDPVAGVRLDYQPWSQDNANVPAPKMGPREAVIAPGELVLRTQFEDFLGSYVMHCHRLNHEDNGLMALIDVIPAVSSLAVTRGDSVEVRNGANGSLLASVRPWQGTKSPMSVFMSDLDGDSLLDLVVAGGPEVVAYSGAGPQPFTRELARFQPFGPEFRGSLKVAAGNLEGNGAHNNIVVAGGPKVRVFASALPELGKAPAVLGEFAPYAGNGEISGLAVGMIESGSGLYSIVTAPAAGQPAQIRAFRYELKNSEFCGPGSGPKKIAEFYPFGAKYQGGLSLACDWTSAIEGGAQMIMAGQLGPSGRVGVFSGGSALDGYPQMYQEDPMAEHERPVRFHSVLNFKPFPADGGVRLTSSSTTKGSDLLVSGPDGVRKYRLARANPKAAVLSAALLGPLPATPGAILGGD